MQILPLAAYLAKSPVWGDRQREQAAWWTVVPPRWLDAVCTAIPYAYGSQRRGHPNLARALGVHNLNESAGGFAGLATLIWLAPLAFAVRAPIAPGRVSSPGWWRSARLGAFRLPPVDNLLRALPVLDVTDNRRLTLWVAFGLTILGGIGLDHLGETVRLARGWIAVWRSSGRSRWDRWRCAVARVRAVPPRPGLRALRARRGSTAGADPATYRQRAERQVRRALEFLPRYLWPGGGGARHPGRAGVVPSRARGRCPAWVPPVGRSGMTLVDLGLFGFGLNPAIAPELHDPSRR